ncbi:MAG: tetratricopeptide repeat protein [Acidobacteria bacterium]|nr:tetratricopeptide repeat protein [Acidobacteriota bacterium]
MRLILLLPLAGLLMGQHPPEIDALYRARKFAEAARRLESHLAARPGDVNGGLLLGLCYQQSGELEKAEARFRAVAAARPRNGAAHFHLGRALYLRSKLREAEAEARKSGELGEPVARVRNLLGLILAARGDPAAALPHYALAMEADPRFGEAHFNAGVSLFRLGRFAEAAARLDEAIRLQGGDEAKAYRGRVAAALREARPGGTAAPGVRFTDVAAEAGIRFRVDHRPTPERRLPETMPGGVAAFDYDNDGRMDLLFTNPNGPHALYRNLGGWRFADATAAAGLGANPGTMGVAVGDFDGDGWSDVFLAGLHRNTLYRNTGGRFVDVTKEAGLAHHGWATGAAWLDYDSDGRLDLFIVNYVRWDPAQEPYCGDPTAGFRVYCHPRHYRGLANTLYRNLGPDLGVSGGGDRFADVSEASGIAAHVGKGMSAAVADYDLDGMPDIFVANDAAPNFLFRNAGSGRFQEVALQAGVALPDDGKPVSGMGTDFRDFNNDGLPDLAVTALNGETFPLFRGLGKGLFADVTWQSRSGAATFRRAGWGVALADFNNDGLKDLFSANGHVTDNVEAFSHETYRQVNSLLVQQPDGSFRDEPGAFAGPARAHRGSAVADFDQDGRLDIAVSALGEPAELWRNVSDAAGSWLRVETVPRGAVVRVAGQVNSTGTAVGYASSADAGAHFGLGARRDAADIEIVWPGGAAERHHQVPLRQAVTFQRSR